MGNLDQESMGIYDMLDEVSQRPAMYLGSKKVNNLASFIWGYRYCSHQHKHRYRSLYPLPFGLFTSYCAMKFHVDPGTGFEGILLRTCHEDQEKALHKFFEVLNEFRKNARVTMCRKCELSKENINYHLTGKGSVRLIGSYSDGTVQRIPVYQTVKQFYHIAFSYGADLLIPVSNDETVSGCMFYDWAGESCLEVYEHLEAYMVSCFGSVNWKQLELTDEDILLLLNDCYFNNGKTEGIKPNISN